MNLLNLLNGSRSEQPRNARTRKARVGLEPLEGRLAMSGATAALPVGPISYAQHASLTTPPPVMTQSSVQTGTAFGLSWRAYYDPRVGQYRMDVQDVAGRGQSAIVSQNGAGQMAFSDLSTVVNGPRFATTARVQVRVFTDNAPGALFGPDKNLVGIGVGSGVFAGFTTHARTMTGNIGTPQGNVGLSYAYNCVTNTGVLTVKNVNSHAAPGQAPVIYYSKGFLNNDPGDPAPDSPSSNPLNTVDFQMQGSGGDYNGGVNVFMPGLADASITVNIDNSGAGRNGYVFQKGAGF